MLYCDRQSDRETEKRGKQRTIRENSVQKEVESRGLFGPICPLDLSPRRVHLCCQVSQVCVSVCVVLERIQAHSVSSDQAVQFNSLQREMYFSSS